MLPTTIKYLKVSSITITKTLTAEKHTCHSVYTVSGDLLFTNFMVINGIYTY